VTSPRYPDIEEAWSRFLDGQPREALAFLSGVVREGARTGPAFDRRVAAIEALGELGAMTPQSDSQRLSLISPAVETAALAELAVPALAEALADPDMRIRHRACTALRQIGPPAAGATAALRRLRADPDPLLRAFSERALAAIQPAASPDG
jgi:hypothetical protein